MKRWFRMSAVLTAVILLSSLSLSACLASPGGQAGTPIGGTGTAPTSGGQTPPSTGGPVGTPLTKTGAPPSATGTFIQMWMVQYWGTTEWATEFSNLKSVGITTIVIQTTAEDDVNSSGPDTKVTYYPNTLNSSYGYVEAAGYGNQVNAARSASNDSIACCLAAAPAGTKVYFGLNGSNEWPYYIIAGSTAQQQQAWLGMVSDGNAIASDLYKLYGSSSAFAGFYWPWEVDNVNFVNPADTSVTVMQQGLCSSANYVHTKLTASKPLMLSPYMDSTDFSGNPLQPSAYQTMWASVFQYNKTHSGLGSGDIFCPQDGCGTQKQTPASVPSWFTPLESTCAQYGLQFWADTETFAPATNQIPASTFIASTLDRVVQQLAAEQPIVKSGGGQIVFFSWSYYDSPTQFALPGFQSAYQYYLTNGSLPVAQIGAPNSGQIWYQNGSPAGWQFNAPSDYASILGYKLYWHFSDLIMMLSPIQYTQATPPVPVVQLNANVPLNSPFLYGWSAQAYDFSGNVSTGYTDLF